MIKSVTVCTTATPEHAIGSLRLSGPLRAAGIQIHWHMPGQEINFAEAARTSDLFVVQRDFPRFAGEYATLRKAASEAHKPVIFELDDLLWDLPPDHPDRKNGFYSLALYPMVLAALEADGLTTASPGLYEVLQLLNPSVWLLPNYLDEQVWELREPEIRTDDPICLGYMGGDSHLADIQMIQPVLLALLEEYRNRVRLKFWGVRPPNALLSHPSVEWQALQPGNYAEFGKYFSGQSFDIFMAPLQDYRFNHCKSTIKYLEYTTLGIPGVSSKVSPYQAVVQQGVTGYLAANLDEWHSYLCQLIESPDLRGTIASHAQEAVRQNWLLSDHSHLWREAYQSVVKSYQPEKQRPKSADVAVQVQEQIESIFAQQAHELSQHEAELSELKSSRAWKLVSRYYHWRSRFSPPKSPTEQE